MARADLRRVSHMIVVVGIPEPIVQHSVGRHPLLDLGDELDRREMPGHSLATERITDHQVVGGVRRQVANADPRVADADVQVC